MKMKKNKKIKKEKREKFKKELLERDNNECQLSKILKEEEWNYLLNIYEEDYNYLCKFLDVAHIYSKAQRPDLEWEKENCIILCRYFHSFLDQLKHPIFRTSITKEERLNWMFRTKGKKVFFDKDINV